MVAVVGSPSDLSNVRLVDRWAALGLDVELVAGDDLNRIDPGDVVLARIDVRRSVDGVDAGLLGILLLERRGVDVRNPADALLGAHDKWRTARLLARASLPHPRTRHAPFGEPIPFAPPVVLKPRFGSWGIAVRRCLTQDDVDAFLREAAPEPWYRRHGLVAQEDIPSSGHDLRVLVAAGRVVGAIERFAREGEWRTNVSCGGSSRPASPSAAASELAVNAAAAANCDLVGVDLLPLGGDRYVVIELNAAADFDDEYSQDDQDVYRAAADALGLTLGKPRTRRAAANAPTRVNRGSGFERALETAHELAGESRAV